MLTRRRVHHPSGQEALAVREAYFHKVHARHLGDWFVIAGWILLGAMVGGFFVVAIAGLVH